MILGSVTSGLSMMQQQQIHPVIHPPAECIILIVLILLRRWVCWRLGGEPVAGLAVWPRLLHPGASHPPLTRAILPLNGDSEAHEAWQTAQCVMIKCLAGERRRRRRGRLKHWEHNAGSPRLSRAEQERSVCRGRGSSKKKPYGFQTGQG